MHFGLKSYVSLSKKAMKKIYLLFMLTTFGLHSQSFEWLVTSTITLGLNPNMVGYSVTCDPSNNVYFLGYKSDPFPYNSIMGHLYFNKYNSDGELIFTKNIGGKVASHNMVADSQGNLILALSYVETLVFGDIIFSNPSQGETYVMMKLNSDGVLLYSEEFEFTENSDQISDLIAIATDSFDNIYLGYGTFMDSYISKFSPDGNLIFTIDQLHVARVTSLDIDQEGNIYAAGSCADQDSQFAGVTQNSGLDYNTYLVKYTPEGVYEWVKFVEDITCIEPKVAVHSPDEIYFSSILPGPYLFDTIQTDGGSGFFYVFSIVVCNLCAIGIKKALKFLYLSA